MSIQEIKIIARYESRLITRTYLWHIFAWGSIGLTVYQLLIYFRYSSWDRIALDSSVPFLGAYYFNYLQAFMLVYVGVNFMKKYQARKAMEVLDVYPVSNTTLLFSNLWGMVRSFAILFFGVIFVTILIHVFALPVPFYGHYYLFYALTLVFPTFIFMLGFSFWMAHVIKHYFGALIALLLFLFLAYLYLPTVLHGFLDPWGRGLPNSFSGVMGHSGLLSYLLQRLMILSLGVGFIFFTLSPLLRIPNKSRSLRKYMMGGIGCVLLAIVLLACNYNSLLQVKKTRAQYKQSYLAYCDEPYAHVVSHQIEYTPKVQGCAALSRMVVCNEHSGEISRLLLFLNPGLQITRLVSEGRDIPYKRDNQVLLLDYTLAPGAKATFELSYEGMVDEHLCFLDIDDRKYNDTGNNATLPHRYGRKLAFCDERYTLLTPECLWYPTVVPPLDLASPLLYKMDFTDYTLTVDNKNARTVLSQGRRAIRDKQVVFKPEQALHGLSLCIGDYKRRTVTVDDTDYELYNLPNSQFLIDQFNGLDLASITELVCQLKNTMESNIQQPYPFPCYALVEVPVSFSAFKRWWRNDSPHSQPEFGFIPERAIGMYKNPIVRNKKDLYESAHVTLWNYLLHDKVKISSQIRLFTGYMTSDNFPGLHGIMQILVYMQGRDRFDISGGYNPILEETACFFNCHSFQEAISNPALQVPNFQKYVEYKVMDLQNWVSLREDWGKVEDFLMQYLSDNKFRSYDFEELRQAFIREFNFDLAEELDKWYAAKGVPSLMLKDIEYVRFVTENRRAVVRLSFKVYNPSRVDGIISRLSSSSSMEKMTYNVEPFIIKAGECKEIRGTFRYSSDQKLTTGLSFNQPSTIGLRSFTNVRVKEAELPPFGYEIYPLDIAEFGFGDNLTEFVVDNIDEGFRIVDSRGQAKKLTSVFKKKQKRYGLNIDKARWTEFMEDYFYGLVSRTVFRKLEGTGQQKVEWHAQLPRKGYYEIFAYLPPLQPDSMDEAISIYLPSREQFYTVHAGQHPTEVRLLVDRNLGDWHSLGKYYFSGEEPAIVSLDDRTGKLDDHPLAQKQYLQEGDHFKQYIVADAVKWVWMGDSISGAK